MKAAEGGRRREGRNASLCLVDFSSRKGCEGKGNGPVGFFFCVSSRSMLSLTPFFSSRSTHGKWKFREYEYLA
jgi:hypothetical protein